MGDISTRLVFKTILGRGDYVGCGSKALTLGHQWLPAGFAHHVTSLASLPAEHPSRWLQQTSSPPWVCTAVLLCLLDDCSSFSKDRCIHPFTLYLLPGTVDISLLTLCVNTLGQIASHRVIIPVPLRSTLKDAQGVFSLAVPLPSLKPLF